MTTPTIVIPGEAAERACARVAKMMMMSSRPYIFLRPTISARIPKPNWPMTVPPEVETLRAVSAEDGMAELKYTTPIMAVTRLIAKIS